MGIQKSQIGFHIADGGNVYKVGKANSLISYYYCDFCKSSSSTGNLSMSEVTSDITGLSGFGGVNGDLPGTDRDYVVYFKEMFTTAYGLVPDLIGEVSDNPATMNHKLLTAFNTIKNAGDAAKTNLEKGYNEISGQMTTKGVVFPSGATTSFGSYWNGLYDGITSLGDSTGCSAMTDFYSGVIQTDSSVTGTFVTADHTADNGIFNHLFLSVTAPGDSTGTYNPWVRTENVKIEVSNDAGTSWVPCKYIDQDQTDHDVINVWGNWVLFPTDGNGILKLRVNFNPSDEITGILGLYANWSYDITENDYINDSITESA